MPLRACTVFAKKLGLEGFKDLKVELIRLTTEAGNRRDVDIDFPFDATSTPAQVMERMEGLYQTTLAETQELLGPAQLDYACPGSSSDERGFSDTSLTSVDNLPL